MSLVTRFVASSAVVMLSLLMGLQLHAQVGVGVRAGAVFSHFNFEQLGENVNSDNLANYIIGVPVELRVPGPLDFQAEANFLRRGGNIPKDLLADGKPASRTNLTYLEITALAKLGYTGQSFELAAVAGPCFGYALTGYNIVNDVKSSVNFTDGENIGRADLGLTLGVQAGIPAGGGRLMADVRYRIGLNDLNSNDNGNVSTVVKMRSISATVGYMWTLGL